MQKSLGLPNKKGKEKFLYGKTSRTPKAAYWPAMDQSWQSVVKRELRQQKKKQGWLASSLGVSEPTFSSWMHGRHNPSLAELKRIAKLLQISITEMLENDDSVARTPTELDILRKFRHVPIADQDRAAKLVDAILEQLAPPYHQQDK